MKLLYDKNDLRDAKKLRDDRFKWLMDLGAAELSETPTLDEGFLFAYQHGEEHYRNLVCDRPNVVDRPEQRRELTYLDEILRRLDDRGITVPRPKSWLIGVDQTVPADLEFPLFVRTPKSSWKRGGTQGKVKNAKQLDEEIELLRRGFGWNSPILARQWIDVAVSGKFMFGNAPQEIRVWLVDQRAIAWSFHYLHVVPVPKGFPPTIKDLMLIAGLAEEVGSAFGSRLIVADFVRDRHGTWWFLEAGPGSAAGTAHETVFKNVAERLRGGSSTFEANAVGGPLSSWRSV